MAGDIMRKRLPLTAWHPDLPEWFEGLPFLRPTDQQYIRVEEFEQDGTYVVQAELPGIDPGKDAEITVQDGVLTIRAERSEEHRDKHRSEFRYGSFQRTVQLPSQAKEEDVSATYADGVLTVKVPLDTGKPTARQIQIKRGG
ncbi:Hsp20/alpha crystallin family protein [Kitasatospora sp. MAP5-34]|uniref:Hsp20/alpha crystallin family protein n=1 Tax=Kitasatospora sp. MAP5-34 TaxID=3035102 RepID=UPI002474BB26|nr:Hsp20/alpha crystallin family protein [Kitasatospora sp. MAP5-34]MDH6580493.1 HSP20 family protein [Kitasatospora sp. MAP5-34]